MHPSYSIIAKTSERKNAFFVYGYRVGMRNVIFFIFWHHDKTLRHVIDYVKKLKY